MASSAITKNKLPFIQSVHDIDIIIIIFLCLLKTVDKMQLVHEY